MIDFQNIFPEIFLTLSILFLLIAGVFLKNSFGFVKKLTIFVLLVTIPIVYLNNTAEISVLKNNYTIDFFSNFFKILILLSTTFAVIISGQYISNLKIDNASAEQSLTLTTSAASTPV